MIKRMKCPRFNCLGIAEVSAPYTFWCKVCGSKWFIREVEILTKSKKAPFISGVPSSELDSSHLYEKQNSKFRRGRY